VRAPRAGADLDRGEAVKMPRGPLRVGVAMVAQWRETHDGGVAGAMGARGRRESISSRQDPAAFDESRLADAPWSRNNAAGGREHDARCS
jgi:hypothetical protein